MVWYFVPPTTCPFTVLLAAVFLLVANVAFGIFLACLFFHPLLNSATVWADTDSSALDVQAAREGRKKITGGKYNEHSVTYRQFPLSDTVDS